MDKQTFFAVWDLPELRHKIKSYMFPHKKTANYYDYRNGDMASYHGYLRLIIERSDSLSFSENAMNSAAEHGHLDVVIWLHYNRTEG